MSVCVSHTPTPARSFRCDSSDGQAITFSTRLRDWYAIAREGFRKVYPHPSVWGTTTIPDNELLLLSPASTAAEGRHTQKTQLENNNAWEAFAIRDDSWTKFPNQPSHSLLCVCVLQHPSGERFYSGPAASSGNTRLKKWNLRFISDGKLENFETGFEERLLIISQCSVRTLRNVPSILAPCV